MEEYDDLTGHRLAMAEYGRGDDQVAAGWGKKPGKTRPIVASCGVKRSVLTDGRGVPLGVAVDGANVHDQKLVAATLDSIPVRRPQPHGRRRQHLCADKGYDAAAVRRAAAVAAIAHIPRKGEDSQIRNRRKARGGAGSSNALTPGSTARGGC